MTQAVNAFGKALALLQYYRHLSAQGSDRTLNTWSVRLSEVDERGTLLSK